MAEEATLEKLDLESVTVEDLSTLKDTVLRSILIDELEKTSVEYQLQHYNFLAHGNHTNFSMHSNIVAPFMP